jgi:hypothetical protein
MPFTNVWSNTFPPDTQLASQLGSDIRDFRVDVQERMAAMSGNDADKPSFEPGFAGRIFIAVDTGKIYRWSGIVWTDVTDAIMAGISAASLELAGVATSGKMSDLIDLVVMFENVKATPGYQKFPNNLLLQWSNGVVDAAGGELTQVVNWQIPFAALLSVQVTTKIAAASNSSDVWYQVINMTNNSVTVQRQSSGGTGTTVSTMPMVFGIGTYA